MTKKEKAEKKRLAKLKLEEDKKDPLFTAPAPTEEEDEEDEEEDEELEEEETVTIKKLADDADFGVQEVSKTKYLVVSKDKQVMRTYVKEDGCEDPKAAAISYAFKLNAK